MKLSTITGFLFLATAALLITILSTVYSFADHNFIALFKLILTVGLIVELWEEFRSLLQCPASGPPQYQEWVTDLLAILSGALAAFFIHVTLGHGPVLASAVTGLLATAIAPSYAAAVYCGSFIGMASPAVFTSMDQIIIASICSAGIYILAKQSMAGFGGKLGTIAFLGSLASAFFMGAELLTLEAIAGPQRYTIVVFACIGAAATFALHAGAGRNPVAASASIGLAAILLLPYIYGAEAGNTLAVVTFCASFIGMTSNKRTTSWLLIGVSSLSAALMFIFSPAYLHGAGGKLGTIAFASILSCKGLERLVCRILPLAKQD